MTDDPRTPLSGEQPPYGIPPQQPPDGGQQPQYFPSPQGRQQPPSGGQQQPPYFPPPQPGYQRGQQQPGGPAGPGFQYPWQRPGGGQPPRPPQRKSHKTRNIVLGVLGAFVLIIVIASVASNGGNSPSASSTSQPPAAGTSASTSPSAAPATAALSTTGADGDFKFTVTSWSCGQAASDAVYGSADGFASQPAGTTECVAMLSVTNVHDGAQDFFPANQYAINLRGQKLSADDNAIYMSGYQLSAQVNPGVTVTAPVAFNFPAGETIAKLELHDSAFSGGVDVKP